MQRTIMEALMPELTVAVCARAGDVGDRDARARGGGARVGARYDAAEIKDLRATFAALKRLGDKHIAKKGGLRGGLARATRAGAKNPPDRRAMEAAIASLRPRSRRQCR